MRTITTIDEDERARCRTTVSSRRSRSVVAPQPDLTALRATRLCGWRGVFCVVLALALLRMTAETWGSQIAPLTTQRTSQPAGSRSSSSPSKRDEALIQKLLGDATGRDRGPAMDRALEGMQGSEVKLSRYFDAGAQTQKIQRQIIRDLDEAIAEALKAQRTQSSSSTTTQAEKARRPATAPMEQREAQASQPTPQDANRAKPDDTQIRGRPATAAARASGEMRELRRGWGRLPPRDRDEVLQGFEQDFLTKYREWIERYYRALANPQQE
jgi:hypothetical protein